VNASSSSSSSSDKHRKSDVSSLLAAPLPARISYEY
jgi:hypothetical protein